MIRLMFTSKENVPVEKITIAGGTSEACISALSFLRLCPHFVRSLPSSTETSWPEILASTPTSVVLGFTESMGSWHLLGKCILTLKLRAQVL